MTAEAYLERVESERAARHESRRRWWTAVAVAVGLHAALVSLVVVAIVRGVMR